MPHRSLPATFAARLQDGLLLTGALFHRGVVVIGLRSLEHAFTHQQTPYSPRELRRPFRPLVRFGYWMLGGVTTVKWDPTKSKTTSQNKLRNR